MANPPSPTATSTAHGSLDEIDVTVQAVQDMGRKNIPPETLVDIEHVFVKDDPRKWSRNRKLFTLITIASAALIATLGINIYNPAINSIKEDLHATDQQISLSLSIFILFQGLTPLLWSAISEIRGRKIVYLVSISMYLVGCSVAGSARSIAVLITMRILQAMGGSAVVNLGAATLADIYDPAERGRIVGIFYAAPLLGPSLGPLIGGVATQLFSWRATFYFLIIFAGLFLVAFIFFKDTFRRERSLSYQNALKHMIKEREARLLTKEKRARLSPKSEIDKLGEKIGGTPMTPDLEAHNQSKFEDVHVGIREINPIRPLIAVLKRRNNITILIPSAMIFAFTYCITYTIVRTLSAPPYSYNSLGIGLILLAFGIGSMAGSLLGGIWSDYVLLKCKIENQGRLLSEDRLKSTKAMMLVLPASLLAYAWMAHEKVNIAGICVALFFMGLSSIWIYSSTLAYIVDANVGRSSTAVASNSLLRCVGGFVAAEVAVPLQNALGDGGLYTLWAVIMLPVCGLILLTIAKGGQWREAAEGREKEEAMKS